MADVRINDNTVIVAAVHRMYKRSPHCWHVYINGKAVFVTWTQQTGWIARDYLYSLQMKEM